MLKSLCEISAFSFKIVNSIVHWKLILPTIFVVSTINTLISFPVTSFCKRHLFVSQMECIEDFSPYRLIYSRSSDSNSLISENITCTSFFFQTLSCIIPSTYFCSGLETAANIEITGKIQKGIDFLDLNITQNPVTGCLPYPTNRFLT